MGAVIDEGLQNRVEICVLGTSDMGGRGVMPRRPLARARAAQVEAAAGAAATPAAPVITVAAAKAEEAAALAIKATQDEFGFGEIESRGQFEKTDRNLYDGQDLDVPTYLRKGIRISI